jgi:hypothetical protein
MRRARTYVDRFLADFASRITFGRRPDPGEPLRWLLHVNPFRNPGDADHLARALHAAGLEADPDDGRPEAIAHATSHDGTGAIFRRVGPFWSIAFDGFAVQLTDQKGFHDLARLLASPGREIHCLELASRPDEGHGEPVVDERARREIEQRVRDLQRELDDADRQNDQSRSTRAREELGQIVEALSGAIGLRGRPRQTRQRCGAGPIGRDVAHAQRDEEDRINPSKARPASRELGEDGNVLRV